MGRRHGVGAVLRVCALVAGVAGVAGVAAGCGGAAASGPPPASSPSPLLGRPLPGFERVAVGGQAIDSAALRGRVVVVKFFARWCAPCVRSLPALERLHRARREVQVIGVSLDEDAADAQEQIARHGLSFPVIHDPARVLGGRFRVAELPIAFVADRAGTLVWVGGPDKSHADLDRAAEAAR